MAEAQTGETKSIINAKYKDKYKTPDWLGVQINKHCTATHEVEVPEKKDDKGKVISKATTKTVANGIDLLGYSSAIKYMVTGLILLAAVTLDTVSRRRLIAAGR